MSKDKIKGGKADKMSIADIAKKHDVSVESIKAQIEMGKKIEMEHVDSEKLAEEISMDHLDEIPDYYTRLNKMEKEAKKELSLESKKLMALAGIKEGDKKFLNNESFSEPDSATLYPDGWKEMDGMFMGPNRITQEKLDAVSKLMKESMGDITPEEWAQMHPERQLSKDEANPSDWKGMDSMRMGTSDIPSLDSGMNESKDESDFIIMEFDQEDVEPGHDDEELYRLNK
jgi:hypothetical protein